MKKMMLGALAGIAAAAMAAPAAAAPVVTTSSTGALFTNDSVTGTFSDSFTILGSAGFTLANLTLSSSSPTLDFTSVLFNGTEFEIGSTGTNEFRFLNDVPLLASNTLIVSGTAGAGGRYNGNVSFLAPTGAVPEPGTWGMMLVGFGAVGYGMRRKAKVNFVRTQAV